MGHLVLDIVTPEKRILLRDDVKIVTVQTVDGEVGILPGHVPLYSQLVPGVLKYRTEDAELFASIHGGFLEVANGRVTVLADAAARAEDLDEAVVEEARRKAEEAMSQRVSDEDYALAEGAMRKALLDLRAARRRKGQR